MMAAAMPSSAIISTALTGSGGGGTSRPRPQEGLGVPLGSVNGGLAATEKLLNTGDPEYDRKMTELWGGPPPRHFPLAMERWPTQYPSGVGRTALVTGSSGGIGFYAAKLLARMGFDIIVPQRTGFEDDAAGAAAAIERDVPGARVSVPAVALDLQSLESCRMFGAAMCASGRLSSLDLLCLNAGRGGASGDPRDSDAEGRESIMLTNVYGHFVLAAALLPLLQASTAARIVTQSSGARFMAKPQKLGDLDGRTDAPIFDAFDQYCLSKAACVLFTQSMNERLAAWPGYEHVICAATDPGLTATGVNIQHQLVGSIASLRDDPRLSALKDTTQMHDQMGHHAADGALALVLACVVPDLGRNDFFTSSKTAAGGASQTDPEANPRDPLNTQTWPVNSSAIFWRQAVALTQDFLPPQLLEDPRPKL